MASPQQTSCDRLSESQAQLRANVLQLKTENENLMARYGKAADTTEQ